MLQKIDIDLKKELNNTRNKQSRLADIIISKENELKLLYEKKTKYKQNSEVAKKNNIRAHVKKEKYDYFIPLVKHKDFASQFKKAKINNKKIKLIDLWE